VAYTLNTGKGFFYGCGTLKKAKDDGLEILISDSISGKKTKTKSENDLKGSSIESKTGDEKDKSTDINVTPYREIILSDGHGLYIKTICNLTTDNRVQVTQYRESPDPDGVKFLCTEPNYFENKGEFLDWLSQILINNFDEIPYITIAPLKESELKKHEKETTDAMYL
jgi:hypothetical protein